uniref:3'-5' exonuclease domain-containing protein n=1 Tax=Chromera velia CCMP2878 TaxID=1169474 RepID=A0A0G4I031_9ALVE|eukprot:Cvel_9858.t1-p1 / transcript=Cvel_9858.t1 / gene=Cvel_9858 / organism=Chromera_velia_CCMP2878 / gene_product=Exonuclease 3'-5' domain-containing protein 1, putative / transcript_product=Exonuclease 3'-5' domain-containing protein 1, putative / location=Cvel_scaffold580:74100-76012(-) / protein_length=469 / sequence_SO=supercontig / SO=protein_coding / is_pseudo=false
MVVFKSLSVNRPFSSLGFAVSAVSFSPQRGQGALRVFSSTTSAPSDNHPHFQLHHQRNQQKQKQIHFIEKADQLKEHLPSLLRSPRVAVDCEGVALGRYGKLCLVQLSSLDSLFIIDALKRETVEALAPLLMSEKVLKIAHDCREDNAALFHQFGFSMKNVFDCQVAHLLIQRAEQKKQKGSNERVSQPLYQASLSDLTAEFLGLKSTDSNALKQKMADDEALWHRRPLTAELVKYALSGVMLLPPLMDSLSTRVDRQMVVRKSARYLEYCRMNSGFKSASELAKPGTLVQAMLVSVSDSSLKFKLNCGRLAVASSPAAVSRFRELEIGDIVDACVSSVSINGTFVYIDRFDPLHDHWTPEKRVKKQYFNSSPRVSVGDEGGALGDAYTPPARIDPHLVPQLDPHDFDAPVKTRWGCDVDDPEDLEDASGGEVHFGGIGMPGTGPDAEGTDVPFGRLSENASKNVESLG